MVTNAEACRQANSNTARIWHELEHIKSIKCNAFHSDNSFIFIQISYDICAWMDSNIKYCRHRVARSNAHTDRHTQAHIQPRDSLRRMAMYHFYSATVMYWMGPNVRFLCLLRRQKTFFFKTSSYFFFTFQMTTNNHWEKKMWHLSCTVHCFNSQYFLDFLVVAIIVNHQARNHFQYSRESETKIEREKEKKRCQN